MGLFAHVAFFLRSFGWAFGGGVVISYIEGQVLFLETGYAVVKTSGVGYHVLLSKKDLDSLNAGQAAELFIHTHVREDAFELYGFSTRAHKQIFLLLISVSGVGPKLALSIISALSPSALLGAIIDKDIATLSSIPGIGKKIAERISLELKEKALKFDLPVSTGQQGDSATKTSLEQAIRGLGYSKSQSDKAMMNLDPDDLTNLPLEALIKKTLNVLTGNKPS